MAGHSREARDRWNAKRRERRAKGKQPQAIPTDLAALVAATRQPIGFEDLCDKLSKSPSAVRRLLEQADHAGIALQVGNNHVQLSPHEQIRTVQDSRIVPTEGERQIIGVLSDLHCGSKYCLRAQIQDCVRHFYERGIRAVKKMPLCECGNHREG